MRSFYLLLFLAACGGVYPDVDIDLTSPETREQIRARCEQGCDVEMEYCRLYDRNWLRTYKDVMETECTHHKNMCVRDCGRIYYFE